MVRAGSAATGLVLIAVLVSSCGTRRPAAEASPTHSSASTTIPASTATSSVTSTSASGGEIATLGNGDASSTSYVRVGATVEVTLTAEAVYRFALPSSSDPSVLQPEATARTATGVTARFRALQPGTARLGATENPTCLPLCGLASRLWEVTVVVTPHPVP
ncbi:MAG TPA: hypothetical protein VF155_09675 [Candidatus Dormibacteraeota bacterium]